MAELDTGARLILLLTNDALLVELIAARVDMLRATVPGFPEAAPFVRAELRTLASIPQAKDWLRDAENGGVYPQLIVIDPRISVADDARKPALGQDINAFLDWLDDDYADLPVLVAAAVPPEEVQRKVLNRPHTGLWLLDNDDPDDAGADTFAETLAGIAPASSNLPLRYTIAVGDQAARYFVLRGTYQIIGSTAIAYGNQDDIQGLLDEIREYTAIIETARPAHTAPLLLKLGRSLYMTLLEKTVGPQITALIAASAAGSRTGSPKLDLRFEIRTGSPEQEELFKLPFELINSNTNGPCYCHGIPMARRLNMGPQARKRPALTGSAPNRFDGKTDYHVLFMRSEVHGTPTVSLESGTILRQFGFNRLRSPKMELDSLMACTQPGGVRRISALGVLGSDDFPRGGAALAEGLRERLTTGGFDFFHFSGHSTVYPCEGTPYLILPDKPNTALAIPIARVAGWLNEGGCKFMVLSSCEGASIITAISTMKGGAEGVIGFRWKVDDMLCAGFFDLFYRAYFRKGYSFAESFREACSVMRPRQSTDPTLPSAVAVLRD